MAFWRAKRKPEVGLPSRYEVRRQIGEGGFGRVYLAYDRQLKRQVAIKALRGRYHDSSVAVHRFKEEAVTVADLQHPNIVTIFDLLEPADFPICIIMEYIAGGSLRDMLKSSRDLTIERIIDIAMGICHGLTVVHDRDIVHRDIKPENVLLTKSGLPKISDFGIASLPRKVDESDPPPYLHGHPGTLAYMSPEQLESGRIDARSDLFSLGAVLYELLTGTHYLDITQCRNQEDIKKLIRHCVPVPPHRRDSTIPIALGSLVVQLLAKSFYERPSNARQVIEALIEIREPEPPSKARPSADSSSEARSPAENHYERARLSAARGCFPQAFAELRAALNLDYYHVGANALLRQLWCSRCGRSVVAPSADETTGYARFWRGVCPSCETQLVFRPSG